MTRWHESYDARPERVPGTNGRPRKRGQRLPIPADMLEGRCHRVSLSIYGRSYRSRITDQVAQEPQGWSRKAVERTASLAMLLRTLVVLWFAKEGHRLWQPPIHRWDPSKADPSFRDMLSTSRRASVRQHVLAMAPSGRGSNKLARRLEHAVAMAA